MFIKTFFVIVCGIWALWALGLWIGGRIADRRVRRERLAMRLPESRPALLVPRQGFNPRVVKMRDGTQYEANPNGWRKIR